MALPGGVANLTNTIVVENTTSSDPADGPVRPVCLTDTSKRGGDISAVGNDIKSLSAPGVFRDLPEGAPPARRRRWLARPPWCGRSTRTLAPPDVVGILRHTARPIDVDASLDSRCDPTAQPAPGLDEYAAVLAADTAGSAPVRETIMDVANTSGTLGADGVFDEGDLSALLNQLTVNPVPLDYGRFDLNGDGYTGGGTTRMDLDGVRPVAWGFSQRHDVLGVKVLRDENAVRDLDVLCHEVTGPHYTGDVMARDNFAKNHCLPTVGLFTDPAFPGSVSPGHATQLRIVALDTGMDPPPPNCPACAWRSAPWAERWAPPRASPGRMGRSPPPRRSSAPRRRSTSRSSPAPARAAPSSTASTSQRSWAPALVTIGDGSAFLVANAEAADEVIDIATPTSRTRPQQPTRTRPHRRPRPRRFSSRAADWSSRGARTSRPRDDGAGGDASAFSYREFTLTQDLPTTWTPRSGAAFGDTTAGVVSLGLASSSEPLRTSEPPPARTRSRVSWGRDVRDRRPR